MYVASLKMKFLFRRKFVDTAVVYGQLLSIYHARLHKAILPIVTYFHCNALKLGNIAILYGHESCNDVVRNLHTTTKWQKAHKLLILYVTGYWKTDQNVTLGLFHFIGPADSYTHTLPVPCCIDRPS